MTVPSDWSRPARGAGEQLRSRAMQTTATILALVLSAASLSWQAASFFLSGGRVSLELRAGAIDESGTNMITAPLRAALREEWTKQLVAQSYTRAVIAVRVRNTGRMPVTVERWSLVGLTRVSDSVLDKIERQRNPTRDEPEMEPTGDGLIGPQLPHLLPAGGASATWAVNAMAVSAFAAATKGTFGLEALAIVGKVELGDGRMCTTLETLPL